MEKSENTPKEEIPQSVRETPTGPDGNGFVPMAGVWSQSLVGDDGRIYTRKNGQITVDSDSDGIDGDEQDP